MTMKLDHKPSNLYTFAQEIGEHPRQTALNITYKKILYDEEYPLSTHLELYDEIGSWEGFEVVERRDPEKDFAERNACHTYALGQVLGSEPSGDDLRDFINGPEDFLIRHGYSQTFHPSPGSFVLYGMKSEFNGTQTVNFYRHYGITAGNGEVVSKWDSGHVYKHALDGIPFYFGNCVVFFEKLTPPARPTIS